MLRLLSSKVQGRKDFWKSIKSCPVGIHWIALTEYYQISTHSHTPGIQSLISFFAPFHIVKLATSSIRVNMLELMMIFVFLSVQGLIMTLKHIFKPTRGSRESLTQPIMLTNIGWWLWMMYSLIHPSPSDSGVDEINLSALFGQSTPRKWMNCKNPYTWQRNAREKTTQPTSFTLILSITLFQHAFVLLLLLFILV